MKKHEIWFLQKCLDCGFGGEVHSVQNGATAYSPASRTFTYSDILEYAVYDNLTEVYDRSKLTVADKFALMIDAYFLLSELVDKGFLELLDNSKESGLLYRMTTAGATWFGETYDHHYPTHKFGHIFFDSGEDLHNYFRRDID